MVPEGRADEPDERGRPDVEVHSGADGGEPDVAAPPASGGLVAKLESRRMRIVLGLVLVGVLAVAYSVRFLSAQADALLDYFLLLSVATTITPFPVIPAIVYAATQVSPGPAGLAAVALIGAAGTTIAYLLEYAVLERAFSLRGARRIKRSGVYVWLAGLFRRAPLPALAVAAFLPLPLDGVRLMAISERYHRGNYALAAFIGRVPRYFLIAVLGQNVDWRMLAGSWGRFVASLAALPVALAMNPALLFAVALLAIAAFLMVVRRRRLRRRRSDGGVTGLVMTVAIAVAAFWPARGSATAAEPTTAEPVAAEPTTGESAAAEPTAGSRPVDDRLSALLERFDNAVAGLHVVRASFTQRNWSPVFEDWDDSAGDLWYRSPGDLVLRYRKPEHQEAFIDSAGVWVYLVEQKQAQRYPFVSNAERAGSLAVLWRPSVELAARYELRLLDTPPPGESGGTWLALSPRDRDVAQLVDAVYLRLGKRDLSDCILLERANGERVRLEVHDVELNPRLGDDPFQFVPPPGVDIVRF